MRNFLYTDFDTQVIPSKNTQPISLSNSNKTFHCTIPDCGKIFKFKSELTRHSVIHDQVRAFPCPHDGCKKSFKRADALDTHLRLHAKELPFECDVPGCDKTFATKAALKYHVLKHNNDRSFLCPYPGCGRSFFTKGQLKQHEKAINIHLNMVQVKVKEDPDAVVVSFEKEKEDPFLQFYAPPARIVQDMEWEIKNLSDDEGKEEDEEAIKKELQEENLKTTIKYIIDDNKFNKEELSLFTEIMRDLQEEDGPIFDMNNIQKYMPHTQDTKILSFEENEFDMFDFFKDPIGNGY